MDQNDSKRLMAAAPKAKGKEKAKAKGRPKERGKGEAAQKGETIKGSCRALIGIPAMAIANMPKCVNSCTMVLKGER